MHDRPATITPSRPTAPAWTLTVGAVCLLMALLLTAYGPSRLDPAPTRPAAGGAPVSLSISEGTAVTGMTSQAGGN